jgi:hypothetical protein
MAFLGDFGEFFLGGQTTQEVGRDAGRAIDLYFGGTGQTGAAIGDNIGSTLGKIGEGTADQPENQSSLPTPPKNRATDQGIQETTTSGSNAQQNNNQFQSMGNQMQTQQASFGNLLPLLQGAGRLLSSRGGQIATGVGTGVAFGMSGDSGRQKPVLTQSRRNKARVRQLANMVGIPGAAQFLSQKSGRNVTIQDVTDLLIRTFRNDGAYITKAQVRNLRRTTNRFKSLEKQVKEATSMTRTTRRPAMRRASSTTLIKN